MARSRKESTRKPASRAAPAPAPVPVPSEDDVTSGIPRELLQAWVQFVRDDLTGAVNFLNNRLNAIRLAARGVGAGKLTVDELQNIEQIEREVERAAEVTSGLLRRVNAMAPEGAPAMIKRYAARPVRSAHLLVVEDDPSNRSVIARLFQKLGYLVTPVSNGLEAWEALEMAEADCVLCDLRMPGLGGKSLYEQVEENMPHIARRFVFVTGDYTNPESRAFLDKAGCPVIAKPYEVDDLLAAVASVIASRSG